MVSVCVSVCARARARALGVEVFKQVTHVTRIIKAGLTNDGQNHRRGGKSSGGNDNSHIPYSDEK